MWHNRGFERLVDGYGNGLQNGLTQFKHWSKQCNRKTADSRANRWTSHGRFGRFADTQISRATAGMRA